MRDGRAARSIIVIALNLPDLGVGNAGAGRGWDDGWRNEPQCGVSCKACKGGVGAQATGTASKIYKNRIWVLIYR